MDEQNIPPTREMVEAQAAKWDAFGRAITLGAFFLAIFFGLILYLAKDTLKSTAPLLLYFFEGAVVLLVTGSIVGFFIHRHQMHQARLERYKHNTWRFPADFQGNYPAIYDPQTKTIVQAEPGNIQQPVPQTLTYAPHITYKNDIEQLAGAEQQALPAPVTLPSLDELLAYVQPNMRQIVLGAIRETREPALAELSEDGVPHIKFVGSSGTGKSCLAGAALESAIQCNTPDILQIGLLDLEHRTSRLFEDAEHVAEIAPKGKRIRLIGRNPEEVAMRLIDLKQEIDRRASLNISWPFLLVYVEELLALKFEVSAKLKQQMIADFNVAAVRGRKYGVLFLACLQIDYSDKDMREGSKMFGTRGGFALDETAAVASGLRNRPLITQCFEERVQGQYVLEKPGFSGLVLAPAYNVKQKLIARGLMPATTGPTLGSTTQRAQTHYGATTPGAQNRPTTVVEMEPLQTREQAASLPLNAQEKRILAKYREGQSINQIVSSEFTDGQGRPLTGGEQFKQKAREIHDLIRRLLPDTSTESEQ
jgi:hypothetical protein